jgi:hypothetical protein
MNRTDVFCDDVEPLVSKREIAKLYGVNEATINAWVRAYKDFPCVRLPGVNRFKKSDVACWIENFNRPKKGRYAHA